MWNWVFQTLSLFELILKGRDVTLSYKHVHYLYSYSKMHDQIFVCDDSDV